VRTAERARPVVHPARAAAGRPDRYGRSAWTRDEAPSTGARTNRGLRHWRAASRACADRPTRAAPVRRFARCAQSVVRARDGWATSRLC
jgi:hypothetical protein